MPSTKKIIKQFIKFGIVGISNTIVSLAIYYALVFIGLHYILSNAIAFVISVLNAYYWNRKYVFKSHENKAAILPKIYAAYSFTFFLGTGLLFLMVEIIGISNLVAPLLNLFITTPTNFMLNKFWVFK